MKDYKRDSNSPSIIAIGGSLREGSSTCQALKLALHQVEKQGVSSLLIDLRQLNLPFCTGATHYPCYEDVERLRQWVKGAKGILLATPEYHGSLSGVLKNALDLLDEEHFKGKVVGLMAVTGGVHSTNAINALRIICRQLYCWVLPDQLVIDHSEEKFNERGELADEILQKRLDRFIEHFIEAVDRLVGCKIKS